MIFVTGNSCDGCGECIDACPANAIRLQNGKATIDHEQCEGCQACLAACRQGALSDRVFEPAPEKAALRPIQDQTGSEPLRELALPATRNSQEITPQIHSLEIAQNKRTIISSQLPRSSQEITPQIYSLEKAQDKRAIISSQLLSSMLLWTGREILPRLANLALNHLDQRIASADPKMISKSTQIRNRENQGAGSGRRRRQRLHGKR